jgi:hypothetical protein
MASKMVDLSLADKLELAQLPEVEEQHVIPVTKPPLSKRSNDSRFDKSAKSSLGNTSRS